MGVTKPEGLRRRRRDHRRKMSVPSDRWKLRAAVLAVLVDRSLLRLLRLLRADASTVATGHHRFHRAHCRRCCRVNLGALCGLASEGAGRVLLTWTVGEFRRPLFLRS